MGRKCYYPVGAYRSDGSNCYRPCGKCIGCKLEYARQWAIRCVHEAKMHKENSFLTLTYNNQNLPKNKSVEKQELQKFIRKLRKKLKGEKIRFFGCGEYGEKLSRPHYHVCIFGYGFPDKEVLAGSPQKRFRDWRKTGVDHSVYTSEFLADIWKKGFHTIGQVSRESAGYVARYVSKKITGRNAFNHYKHYDYHKARNPEFALMSRMPGIGKTWFDKYWNDIYPKDYFHLDGIRMRPPKYYDSLMEKKNPEMFNKIKERRIEKQKEESPKRLWQMDVHRKKITKELKRRFEE